MKDGDHIFVVLAFLFGMTFGISLATKATAIGWLSLGAYAAVRFYLIKKWNRSGVCDQ